MGGITVGTNLFHVDHSFSNDFEQNTQINWPFAIHYDIEVSDQLELNLTASRNNIIYDEHWFEFMEGLSI